LLPRLKAFRASPPPAAIRDRAKKSGRDSEIEPVTGLFVASTRFP
jgi:hypothetical protein